MPIQLNDVSVAPKRALHNALASRTLRLEDDQIWGETFRLDHCVLIRLAAGVDFEIDFNAQPVSVRARVWRESANVLVEHYFRNHVSPMIRGEMGALVLHGAGIALPNDAAIGFFGVSGRGKSTLAAAFALRGYPLLADDHFELDLTDAIAKLLPSEPMLKLREPSVLGLEMRGNGYYGKRVNSSGNESFFDNFQYEEKSRKCRVFYLLDDSISSEILIEPVAANRAMRELVAHVFYIDTHTPQTLPRQFAQLGALAQRAKFFSLRYPRRFDRLQEVLNTVVSHQAHHTQHEQQPEPAPRTESQLIR